MELAGDVIALLDELTAEAKWDEPLPGIGTSVNEILDLAEKLRQVVDSLIAADASSVPGTR